MRLPFTINALRPDRVRSVTGSSCSHEAKFGQSAADDDAGGWRERAQGLPCFGRHLHRLGPSGERQGPEPHCLLL